MIQKTALSVYRTIVLMGIGFVAGAVSVTYAAEKTGRLKPREVKDNGAPERVVTTD